MKLSELSKPLKALIKAGGKVQALPESYHGPVTVHPVTGSSGYRFRHHGTYFVTPDGQIYANTRLYLLESWGANEAQRNAWARLAGIKPAELKAYRKHMQEQQARSKATKEMASIRAKAQGYGFKLVKARATK